MFEKFAKDAREAVVQAQEEARALGADRIGTEHVLLGMRPHARHGRRPGAGAAGRQPRRAARRGPRAAAGRDRRRRARRRRHRPGGRPRAGRGVVRPGSARRAAADRSQAGHLPFDAAAKKLLEVALREAIRCKHRRIDTGHLLLAVARLDDTHRVPGAQLPSASDRAAAREAVTAVWADVPVG